MRFAIAAVDRYLGVFESFVQAGWTPLRLFTVPLRAEIANQRAVIAYAERHACGIQLSRMTDADLKALKDDGCEVLIVASYDWKIGDWRPHLKYAVNFHSSPLPVGRGPYPPVRAIMENRSAWGLSCHQITDKIDRGPVLAVEHFPIDAAECHERLDLKIQMAGKRLGARVAAQFTALWDAAEPQVGGAYWPKYTLPERIIAFQQPVEQVLRHIRAFGATESLALVNNNWLLVTRAVGWTEAHGHKPGEVVHVFNRSIVVAAADGYVGLIDANFAPPHVVADIQASLRALAVEP